MRQEDAVYGGEMSAHHYFRDFAYCDSGMIPWLLVAELLAVKGKTLSEMIGERMQAFPCSGEINFKVQNTHSIITDILRKYEGLAGIVDRTDGLSIDTGSWRLNVRTSNTEPLLRLNVESAGNPAQLTTVVDEITKIIEGK